MFININKKIPVSAGLAGGSSNCATVLFGMNKIFNLKISSEKLKQLGLTLGADVPYCLERGTILANGVGEVLTKISPCPNFYVLLAKLPFSVSTANVYKNLDLNNIRVKPNTNLLLNAIENNNINLISNNLVNVLETVVFPIYPNVKNLKEDVIKLGAKGALMSGSGPTVFGIFETKKEAIYAIKKIKYKYKIKDIFVTKIFNPNIKTNY